VFEKKKQFNPSASWSNQAASFYSSIIFRGDGSVMWWREELPRRAVLYVLDL
jgi:hypothetical protein